MAKKEPASAKVMITLPRAKGNESKDAFVGINGVNYLIPKGKPVEVPDFVAEELRRSEAAGLHLDEEKDRMIAESK